ncbi:MAG: flippase-like domain-containing protein [Chloroflexi bacterium]|nr:flippase-like domain-containing protein [Chloroflexota bacterium]
MRLIVGLAGLSLAIALIAVVFLVSDLRSVETRLGAAGRPLLLVIAALAIIDHGIRFARWHLLMQGVAGCRLSPWRGLAGYLAGGTMVFTPARIGEVGKSAYARRLLDVPVAGTVPILIAERFADVLIMAGLAAIGLLIAGGIAANRTPFVAVLAVALAAGIALLALRRFPERLWKRWFSRYAGRHMATFNNSSRTLLKPAALAINGGLGIVAWGIEVAIYALAIESVGESASLPLVIAALAVFPLASLIGALSLLPGGLGATEGSLAALGAGIAGMTLEGSLAAGLIARSAILLTVVATGLPAVAIAILLTQRRRSVHPTAGGSQLARSVNSSRRDHPAGDPSGKRPDA